MRRRVAALLVLALLAAVAVVEVQGAPASAATAHGATVVVQLPDGSVQTRTITFAADSVSGVDALGAAGFEPVTYGQGALGTAVCQILAIGCPSDSSCLTCGGESYWSYWRAPAGTDRFSYSPVGAGATKVRDGDVEGWRWGNGNSPPPLPPSPPPTTAPPPPPSTAPAGTNTGGGPAAGGAGGVPSAVPGSVPTGPAPRADSPVLGSTTAPPSTVSSAAAARSTERKADKSASQASGARASTTTSDERALATVSGADESSGGTWLGMTLFAVLAAVLVTWLVIARRRRRGASAPA